MIERLIAYACLAISGAYARIARRSVGRVGGRPSGAQEASAMSFTPGHITGAVNNMDVGRIR